MTPIELFNIFGRININGTEAQAELRKVDKTGKSSSKSLVNSFKGIENATKSLVKKITVIGVALAGIGAIALKQASDVAEMESKFDTVFGNLKKGAREWADTYSDAVGKSTYQIREFLASNQSLFVGMDMTREEAQKFSKDMIKLGVDLASFNNLADDDALESLKSAIMGNHEASLKFDAVLNENTLKLAMNKMQLKGRFDQLAESVKMQVRFNAVLMQSKDAIGDAEKTAMGFSNQMKTLWSTIKDISITIGKALLPVFNILIIDLNKKLKEVRKFFMNRLEEMANGVRLFVGYSLKYISMFLIGLGKFIKFIEDVGKKFGDLFGKKIIGIIQDLEKLFGNIGEKIIKFLAPLKELFSNTLILGMTVFLAILKGIITSFDSLINGDYSKAVTKIKTMFEEIGKAIKEFFVVNKEDLDNIKKGLFEFLDNTNKSIQDRMMKNAEKMKEKQKDYIKNIYSWATNGQYEVIKKEMIKNGEYVNEGLVEGLEKEKEKPKNILIEIAESLTKAFKERLDIKSPSEVFRKIGNYIMQGLNIGISEKTKELGETLKKVSDKVLNTKINFDQSDTTEEKSVNTEKNNSKIKGLFYNEEATAEKDKETKLLKSIKKVAGKTFDIWKSTIENISQLFGSFSGIFSSLLTGDWLGAITSFFGSAIAENENAQKLIAKFNQAFSQVLEKLSPLFNSLFEALEPLIEPLMAVAIELGEAILPMLEILAPALKSLLEALVPVIRLIALVLTPIIKVFSWVVQKVSNAIKWVADTILRWFKKKPSDKMPVDTNAPLDVNLDTTSNSSDSVSGSNLGGSAGNIDLARLLSPLSNFNSLVNITQNIFNLLDQRLIPSFAGNGSTQITYQFDSINIQTNATNSSEISNSIVSELEKTLANRQFRNKIRMGGKI